MESKAGKKSSSKSLCYEAPLGYIIEDVRPNGGLRKFKSAVYSNVSFHFHTRFDPFTMKQATYFMFTMRFLCFLDAVHPQALLSFIYRCYIT
ncbi:hypothetical protein R6Q59_014025 [Mikania micrantha]